jgi:hypothetical protein
MFFVTGLFAGELSAGMADLELTPIAWAFISVTSIFFQNTMRHVLDAREIMRIAVPFGTSLLWGLALRLIEVGQTAGFSFTGASGPLWAVLRDHDLKDLVGLAILLSYYGFTPASRYMRDLLIARIGGELVVDHIDLFVHLSDFYTELIYAYEESPLAEALGRVQELALDVLLPLAFAAIQDSQVVEYSIVRTTTLISELCMHYPVAVLQAITSWGWSGDDVRPPVVQALQYALVQVESGLVFEDDEEPGVNPPSAAASPAKEKKVSSQVLRSGGTAP